MAKTEQAEDLEYEVLDVYEKGGHLVVEVEHEYGKQKFGLSLDAKYLGNDGQPKWKSEVATKLARKFENRLADKSLPETKLFQEEVGKKHKVMVKK